MKESLKRYSNRELVVIHLNDSVERAHATMDAAAIRHLPVVDDQGFIVGMLSDRDVLRAMQFDHADLGSDLSPSPSFSPDARVRDFMSWPIETIDEGRSVADAARMMVDQKISSLLVVRGSDAVGVVTTQDLLLAMLRESEGTVEKLAGEVRSAVMTSPIGAIAHQFANAGI